jgi:hypothetical protein
VVYQNCMLIYWLRAEMGAVLVLDNELAWATIQDGRGSSGLYHALFALMTD